jgi:hypothetical protein
VQESTITKSKKAWHAQSSTKSMLIVFFSVKAIVHHEFVPNIMVSSDFYSGEKHLVRHLRENVAQKRSQLWRNNNWLRHNNIPALMSLKTTDFVTNNNSVIVPHTPYSLDLAPCDFALFPKLKMKLKGKHFETVSDIQTESPAVLDSIKENDFHGAFEVWEKQWNHCKHSQDEYFFKETAAKAE